MKKVYSMADFNKVMAENNISAFEAVSALNGEFFNAGDKFFGMYRNCKGELVIESGNEYFKKCFEARTYWG